MAESKKKFQSNLGFSWKKLFFELIVVFLGVMAAFLLNNWQIERQEDELEQKYLLDFSQDLNDNITMLKEAIKADSSWIARIQPKLILIREGTISVDSANALTKQIVFFSRIDFKTGTYKNITNSGKLNIIRNFILRKEIVDYHISVSETEFIDDYFYKYFNDFVMPFIFSNFSILKGKMNNPEIRKTNYFANIMAGYFSMIQQRKTAYEDLLAKSYKLRDKLQITVGNHSSTQGNN